MPHTLGARIALAGLIVALTTGGLGSARRNSADGARLIPDACALSIAREGWTIEL